MDPNACLAALIDAACEGDASEMYERALDLRDWLRRDGFKPTDPRKEKD